MLVEFGKSFVDVTEEMKPEHQQVKEKIVTHGSDETSFLIGDLGDVIHKLNLWKKCLPNVEPFFAMKVNSLEPVIRLLADMGLSFDCASKDEIRMVLELGVNPSRIIYANTFKQTAFLQYAADNGVSLMTFDCESELIKIKTVFPTAELVLRIDIETDFRVKIPLRKKFGCPNQNTRQVLQTAKDLQLNVVGVSFHVGSLLLEATAFDTAIRQARQVFDIGLEMGFDMKLLDIGGGFPGAKINNMVTDITFEKIADAVNAALERYFQGIDARVIAEPGRYFVASAFTVATNIVTKKISYSKDGSEEERVYIINDGVYGCFNEVIWNPGCFIPQHFKENPSNLFPSTIWGATCDIFDLVIEKYRLPDLEVGDWIYFKDVGAYTVAFSSEFCGMPKATQYFVCDSEKWNEIYRQKTLKHDLI